jgi:hypothetical protein
MKHISKAVRAGLVTTVAGLAIGAAGTASAQAVASAALGLTGYTLVDLDPSDGVAPWIRFQDQWTVATSAGLYGPGPVPLQEDSGTTFGSVGVASADGSAQASAAPGDVAATISAYAGSSIAQASNRHYFELSPNTGITFFASGHLATDGLDWGSPVASVTFVAVANSFGEPPSESIARDVSDYSVSLSSYAEAQGVDPVTGWVDLSSFAFARAFAPPVPEPALPAMLLGGLALLGARAGRRRRRAQASGY